ncbi:2-dehydro-3-deoxygalactonokinase [Fulvimarina endophytica]|uniref:2-dehydro-3-deoxygalactonokinase n=1 Tax=Fulvimarina endophytica TaxID=2293836 RepID=A0A371WZB0_9HYPH|nr:2-dehydro-3-deoxygalactonokinase [Fulvimarina endophytica]RFC62313.1 2-dehydro-3-deoxygalactonokinase [Fulvimarina endophytica]
MTADAGKPAATAAYAACDWGTSNLRVWAMSAEGEPLAVRQSADGMANVGEGGFATVLDGHLAELGLAEDLSVVACGMVGARQGWAEAPYLPAPARIEGLAVHAITAPGTERDVRILPGVFLSGDGAGCDVMRGEETQLFGLALQAGGDHLACLPGTHSKWARLEAGGIVDFATFMTGELFALLSRHAVIRHSLDVDLDAAGYSDAFEAGLKDGSARPEAVLNELFALRARDLLTGAGKADLTARLSGLLIGCELAGAGKRFGEESKVALVASGMTATLYERALRAAGYTVATMDAEVCVRAGLHAAARHLFDLEGART